MTRRPYLPDPGQELLLQAALGEDDAAAEAAARWRSDVDLEHLDGASMQLVPLLHGNLERLGVAAELRAELAPTYRRSWLHTRAVLRHLAPAVATFEAAGIPVLVHKGAALGALVYDDVAERPMADIDLLVPTAEVRRAVETVLAADWKPLFDPFLALERARHSTGFTTASGTELDLHWNLLIESQGECADEDFWELAEPVEILGSRLKTLCATDHLLQALVHGPSDIEAATIRWIADVVTMTRRWEIDWDRLLDQAVRRRLILVVREGLLFLDGRFGFDLDADLRSRLEGLRATAFERLEYVEKRSRFNMLVLYWRFARRNSERSWLRNAVSFPAYLSHHYGTRRPGELFGHISRKTGARYRLTR